MEEKQRKVVGIIHIGTVNMAAKIIAYSSLEDMRVIENVSREVKYGEKTFRDRHVSFESLNEICSILEKFKMLMQDYDVKEVKVLTTTAIREADNILSVVDQIYVRTGFRIDIIHMAKEIYYKFFGLYYHVLRGHFNFSDKAVLLMDITSGGMGLTCWQSDKLLFQQNIQVGSLSIWDNFTQRQREDLAFPTAVREYIYGTLSSLWSLVQRYQIKYIVLSGRAAMLIGKVLHKDLTNGVALVSPKELKSFITSFQGGLTPYKLMQRFHFSENLANVLMPTLLLYYEVLRLVEVDSIVLMGTTFTEGYYMHYVAEKTHNSYVFHQRRLLLDLARNLADKYVNNPDHSARVEEYASTLFAALYKRIGIDYEAGYLLQLASVLHETGKYINIRKHNLCTYNLIMESDLFGLTDDEKEILANITYYGFDGVHNDNAEKFHALSPQQQILAAKLIAIFRLADSLDKSHLGKISRIWAELHDNILTVRFAAELDISLERWTFNKAGVNFSEVFGISPKLIKEKR